MDFAEYEAQAQQGMTISTPPISLIYGLAYRLSRVTPFILRDRYMNHERISALVVSMMRGKGWTLLPDFKERTFGLSCFLPPAHITDTEEWAKELKRRTGFIVDSGYGKLKGKCIRISNMGITSLDKIQPLLKAII